MEKSLRIITGKIIIDSKLTKESKKQLLNFIKEEATDAQVKALLMDGEIVYLDEQAEEIVNKRFENHHLYEFVDPVSMTAGLVAAAAVAAIAQAGISAARLIVSKGRRACIKKIGKAKTECLNQFKKEAARKKVEVMKAQLSKCNKSNDPKRCMATVKKMIDKERAAA